MDNALLEKPEPRWPAILALILLLGMLVSLPSRYLAGPGWLPWVVVGIGILSMLAVELAPRSLLRQRLERWTLLAIFIGACISNVIAISKLVSDMLATKHEYNGVELLESGAVIWAVNLLIFAIMYWQVDGARPEAQRADFLFADAEDEAKRWQARFIDYLFLSFAVSTSFVPPDYSRPASHRAKVFLMLQASISLVTLFLVAARAVGTLS